ncbi:MAG: OmpA family protein, partial [Bacteroidales bacterium]
MTGRIYSILITVIFGVPVVFSGQNLVVNGNFDAHERCPGKVRHERMSEVSAWTQPTDGSPDYFHPCGHSSSRVPDNKFGFQHAAAGEAYVGMHLFVVDHDFKVYKEYVLGKLSEPLLPEATYSVSFKVVHAKESQYAIDQIGAFLSREPVQANTYGMIYSVETHMINCHRVISSNYPSPDVESEKGRLMNDKQQWHEIRDTISARGGENFIILGSFIPNKYIEPSRVNPEGQLGSAYYYFDDVRVEMVSSPPEKPVETKQTDEEKASPENLVTEADSLEPGFTFELENIYFEFDKAFLKPGSKEALEKLYGFLRRHENIRIEIRGHTDSVGSHRYNQKLSRRRAISVRRYLEQKNIKSSRLETKGFGKRRPVLLDTTGLLFPNPLVSKRELLIFFCSRYLRTEMAL